MGRKVRGQVAIVTGASSGVGWQSAVRLADAGAKLCVTARRADALERLTTELVARGAECIAVPGDVTVQQDVEHVVAACVEHYGHVDVLVNSAAVQSYARFDDYDWAEIERVMEVTFFGYLRFARAVLPHFRRQGSGHLINVLSMLSVGAAPLLSVYTAAKHALYGWAESLRLELHGTGIEVSGVLVPSVATPMFDHAPTKLDRFPQPVPPTYDPDVAARAVLRCARRPNPHSVPVFLQGRLILWLQRWAPFVGDFVLGRWGARLQTTNQPLRRREGNLYAPVPEGVGPRGSLPPTRRWKLAAGGLGIALLGAAGVVGLALGARALTRTLR